jgi:hypothetical protein
MIIDLRLIFSPDENKRLMEKIRSERIENLNLYIKKLLLENTGHKIFSKCDER